MICIWLWWTWKVKWCIYRF